MTSAFAPGKNIHPARHLLVHRAPPAAKTAAEQSAFGLSG
jgi:hypothetical protein